MSVQMCEGIWRNRLRQRVVVTQCEPVDGQRWTDGAHHFEDNGALLTFSHSNLDLVEYIGPLPDSSQRAPVSRPAETESTTAVAGGVSEDPGRIIYELEERLKTANATISNQTAEIDRLKGEWQREFTAAQQLRSEVAQLERMLGEAREELQQLQADQAADEQHSEGERAAYLGIIKTLWETRS